MNQFICRTQVKETCITSVKYWSYNKYNTFVKTCCPVNRLLNCSQWSHYLLLKENITDSLGYVVLGEVKKSFHVQMKGVFIAKGENDPRGCSTTLMTNRLP